MVELNALEAGMAEAIVAASPDCIKLLSADGILLFMNDRGIAQNQIACVDAVLGKPLSEMWPAEEREKLGAAIAEAAAGNAARVEGYCPTQQGEPRWWEVYFAPFQSRDTNETRIVGVSRDISSQRTSQLANLGDGRSVELPLETELVGAWTLELSTGEFATSIACRKNFGRDPELPFAYDDVLEATHPDDRSRRAAAVDLMVTQAENLDVEFRIFTPDGQLRWVQVRGEPICDDDGRVVRAQGVSLDITARARADSYREALIELNDRIRTTETASDLAFIAAEILGRTFGVSRAGYGTIDTVEETIDVERDWNARGVSSIAGKLHFREYGSYIEDLKRGDTAIVSDAKTDTRTSDRADELIAITARSFINMPVTEMGRFVALLFVNHASVREWTKDELAFMREMAERTRVAVERRRAELELHDLNASLEVRVAERTRDLEVAHEALRQSQKLEAIGQLTGGVAHDFNNLLTVIGGSADLLKRSNLTEEKRVRYIDVIIDTVGRASKLTGQLLAFARRQALRPETFSVGSNVLAVSDIIRSLTGSRIEVDTIIRSETCFVDADPSQFDTAIINMAVNARDAMNGQGALTIAVAQVDGIPKLRGLKAKSGKFVAVSIGDNGRGIAPENLDNVFEPFFTTKEVGHGTGLGLSQVFGFAKQSGGEVRVESTVGAATKFTLYLPAVTAPDLIMVDELTMPTPIDGDGTCVLIVEDNPDVLEFATQTLAELGYGAIPAIDGSTALAELEKDADRFDAVFSDVMMPGMTGIELGKEIKRLYPALPVVLTSGYSTVIAQQGTHGFLLLSKPYSMDQLATALRKAIAHP